MASPIKNVLLLGGSGNLGPSIIKALSAASFNVSVLTRTSSKSTFPPYVNVIKSDFSPSSLSSDLAGQDAIADLILHYPKEDRKAVIDAAVAAGVKRLIPSEFSGNMRNEKNLALLPIYQERIEIREYLKVKAVENPEFSYTVVSNGPFYDWSLKTGFLGFSTQDDSFVLFDDGNVPFAVSTVSTIGKAVAAILSKPAETANKELYIASFITTQNEILAALEKATGKKYNITKTTTSETFGQGHIKMDKGESAEGFRDVLRVSTYGKGHGNDFGGNATLSNDLLGLPKEDLYTVTEKVVEGEDV